MFTLHCKPLYAPTDITPPNAYPTLARLRRHTHQPCLIIKSIPWGKSDRAADINRSKGPGYGSQFCVADHGAILCPLLGRSCFMSVASLPLCCMQGPQDR